MQKIFNEKKQIDTMPSIEYLINDLIPHESKKDLDPDLIYQFDWNRRPLTKLQKFCIIRQAAYTIELHYQLEEMLLEKFENSCLIKSTLAKNVCLKQFIFSVNFSH